ncbi:uncharacterized protein TEOVI_000066400 [Trypanosoma equiperdum]|uniref:Uncharacterized protein n=2 Tax=Trypanozoon TaxID=39700 RepID=Q584H1_TRYB2|nr:hypothetical protein, conserved [Trypanosoma brucei brucei TREU927]AAX79034.1 hypothetical protein, conserved [Trypanosoma brucei]AAZ10807.1 hypothetical protein, conserved [Trypanosoma brucei brucei TREU927]SCU69107.1 hypothetical protein, conserved [Trypanosoma equiperdum]
MTESYRSSMYLFQHSFCSSVVLAFCLLNGTLAFLFAFMIDSGALAAFAVPAVERGWVVSEKATACRRAGGLFMLLSVLVLVAPSLRWLRGPCRLLSSRLRYRLHWGYRTFLSNDCQDVASSRCSDGDCEMLEV